MFSSSSRRNFNSGSARWNWTTAHLKPWPSERSSIPRAALVFPLPSPVWTMINPLRRRAAAILPRISFCRAFISASCLVASVMGQLQVERNARARAHSKDFENGRGRERLVGTAIADQAASLKQQHAVEVPGHPQIVQGHQQGGAAVRQPPRESEHLE